MEKKTIEQMRNAVLAFCDELDKEGIRLRMMHKGFTQIQKIGGVWAVTIGAKIYFLYDSFEGWEFLYSALGLASRDAVETERTEMMKTVDALSAMVTVDPVAFAQLEAKNAALVAALEDLKQKFGFNTFLNPEFTGGGSHRHINSIGLEISRILQSNKEGVSHEN